MDAEHRGLYAITGGEFMPNENEPTDPVGRNLADY